MKVLFLFQGLAHYYNDVLNRLNALDNVEVVVLIPETMSMSLGKNVYQTDEGVFFKVLRAPEYTTFYGKPFFKNLRTIIEKEQPDIIIAGWPYITGFFVNIFLYRFIRRNNIKLVEKNIPYLLPKYNEAWKFYSEGVHDADENLHPSHKPHFLKRLQHVFLTHFRKFYFRRLDGFVCYVEDAYDILGSYGVEKEKITVVYNSPDTEKIFNTKKSIQRLSRILPENPYRILHVGRLVKWKKVHLLIGAVQRLRGEFKDVELVVVGNGPEEEQLQKQTSHLQLENNVLFVGGVYDPETLGRYFMSSSIYVLAGVGGLSINEAMCYEKPIICSICDGTEKKLVREDINGKYFRNDDENDLYEKIRYLLSRQDLIRAMGKESLRIIQEEVNINTVINGYRKSFQFLKGRMNSPTDV